VGVVRFLLDQGLAFREHDESSTSLNKGNFREILDWYGARCKDVADGINENAPGNCQLTSPDIQKDIVQACAEEITHVIMSELGNACFSLLVDQGLAFVREYYLQQDQSSYLPAPNQFVREYIG
jgi:hypothetical protein